VKTQHKCLKLRELKSYYEKLRAYKLGKNP
jgi:hypothetical protein